MVAWVLVSPALGAPAVAPQSGAAPPSPPPASSPPPERSKSPSPPPLSELDRALLEGLPAKPPVDAPSAPKPPAQAPSGQAAPPGTQPPATPNLPALRLIAQQMLDVKNKLEKLDTSPTTQAEQAQIIARLRQLVGQDNPNPSAATSSQASSAESPMTTGADSPKSASQTEEPAGALGQARAGGSSGQATAPSPFSPRQVAPRLWGHLPEKVREEMQSALGESFVPKYERLIEQYYRRLTEQPPAEP